MSNHNKETEARCPHCYRHYVEGTAAWALYMMRMGHKVTNPKYDPRVYHLPEGGMIHVNGIKSIATNQWIDYWCIDIPDGWQLYEIIGYPVADGSLEWALYQIRSGKKVVKEGGGKRYCSSFYKNCLFYLNGFGCLVTKNAIGLIDPCSEKEFLDLDKTGWQLYEPQPIDSGRWTCYECGVKDSRKGHFPGCSRDGEKMTREKYDKRRDEARERHTGDQYGYYGEMLDICLDYIASLEARIAELVKELLKAQGGAE